MPSNNNTPTTRNLRSNSQTDLTLGNIKALIDASKNEILGFLKAEMNTLRESIASLTSRVENLEKENRTIKIQHQEILQHTSEMPLQVENAYEKISNEVLQRCNRKLNIMISGLPEETNGTQESRVLKDSEKLEEMLQELCIDSSNHKFRTAHRIGKSNLSKPRLIRIECASASQKAEILQKARNLKKAAVSKTSSSFLIVQKLRENSTKC